MRWTVRVAPVITAELGTDPTKTAALMERLGRELLQELADMPLRISDDADDDGRVD
jgi:hypothetical protein